MRRSMQRGLFAALTTAALGFGGVQALAAPAAAQGPEQVCNGGQCGRDCRRAGYDGGFCDQGGCICIIQVPTGP
jgi:hypothetical protein